VLKRVAGRGGHVPGELEQAVANGIPVEGLVSGENKGGYDVQLGSVRAFCPASQMDRRRGDAAQYLGQRLRFRITKLDPNGRNVVVSRRQLLEEEAAAQAVTTWAELREGAVVSGTVSSLREWRVVDPRRRGLIHVSRSATSAWRTRPTDGGLARRRKVVARRGASGRPSRIGLSMRASRPTRGATRQRYCRDDDAGSCAASTVRR
jgi:hypothetical protein